MSKPTKNRVMCPDCGKPKMLFETEKEALGFIKWNSSEMEHGDALRPYYCPACCGFHITHKKYYKGFDNRTERLINKYHYSLSKPDSMLKKLNKTSILFSKQIRIDEIMSQIKTEDVMRCGRVRNFLNMFFQDWWHNHEKFDGWEEVERNVRETVKKKFTVLKK